MPEIKCPKHLIEKTYSKRFLLWILRSLILGIFCLLIVLVAGGAGHGTLTPAYYLFPFALLVLFISNVGFGTSFIVFALSQFLLYGALIGESKSRSQEWITIGIIAIIHVLAVVVAVRFYGDSI